MTIFGRIGLIVLLLGSVTYGWLRHALHLWPWAPVVVISIPKNPLNITLMLEDFSDQWEQE